MKNQYIEDNVSEKESDAVLSPADKEQIAKAVAILKPIADREKCAIADLLEEGSEEVVEEEPADDDKVNLIVARMKSDKGE